jgi:hypothetical protein
MNFWDENNDISSLDSATISIWDLNIPNKNGKTLLMQSINQDLYPLSELLVINGADINAQNKGDHGRTALDYAILSGNNDIIAMLLAFGAKYNVITAYKQTPFHLLVSQGNSENLHLFFAVGADANLKNSEGQNLLEYFLAKRRYDLEDTVKLLLVNGVAISNDARIASVVSDFEERIDILDNNNYSLVELKEKVIKEKMKELNSLIATKYLITNEKVFCESKISTIAIPKDAWLQILSYLDNFNDYYTSKIACKALNNFVQDFFVVNNILSQIPVAQKIYFLKKRKEQDIKFPILEWQDLPDNT